MPSQILTLKTLMIPRTDAPCQAQEPQESWQQALANTVRDPAELLALLQLDHGQLNQLEQACQQFPLRVPRSFVERMEQGNAKDPLLLQVLPQQRELDHQPGFSSDPLQELSNNPAPGLIHKYRGRVLLMLSGACAIHCRYCFRRHFPYQDNSPGRKNWQQALDYIANDPSISEVILSGGDPLASNNVILGELVRQLGDIDHIRRLRIHSRLPIVIPQRIDQALLDSLGNSRLQVVMVVHSNHANELNHAVGTAIQRLLAIGVTVLNQTVLLKDINDTADKLCQLSEKLFQFGVLPYYLHVLDWVDGAAHFQLSDQYAGQLVGEVTRRLPGYLVPKLVREVANEAAKTPLKILL